MPTTAGTNQEDTMSASLRFENGAFGTIMGTTAMWPGSPVRIEIGGENDKENETTIFVSSYDVEEDKDISLYVKATKPGAYTVEKAPSEGAEQGGTAEAPEGEAPGKKAPGKGEAPGVED